MTYDTVEVMLQRVGIIFTYEYRPRRLFSLQYQFFRYSKPNEIPYQSGPCIFDKHEYIVKASKMVKHFPKQVRYD